MLLPSTLPLTSIFLTGNDILLLFFVRNKKNIFDVVIFQFISASLYMVVATSIERFLQLNHPRFSNKVKTNIERVPTFLFSYFNVLLSVGIISWICFTGFGVLRILQHSQVF